jgi:hypothetical protein
MNKKPCKACPFRRTALPGYTGAATSSEFLASTLHDLAMPCHESIDYDDPSWRTKWLSRERGVDCVGAATFFANMNKVSRDRSRPLATPDHETVFSLPQEFADHHKAALPFPILRVSAEKLAELVARKRAR